MRRVGAALAGILITAIGMPSAVATPPTRLLVTHSAASAQAGSNSTLDHYEISGNGRYIAYRADPRVGTPNLINGYVDNSSGESQIYLYDRQTGSNTLVSHKAGLDNESGNGFAQDPIISDDGSFVLYESSSSDIVTGTDTNGGPDVFLYDTASQTNTLVSHSTASLTQAGNDRSAQFSEPMGLSADGTKVAFKSDATDLVAGFSDENGSSTRDLYFYDRRTGVISLITHDATTPANGSNDSPASDIVMSADGTKVAYGSSASNLVASFHNNGAGDNYYVWNASTGTNTLVTHRAGSASEGADNINPNSGLGMSANGQRIVYASDASNLLTGFVDGNGSTTPDVYIYNVGTKATSLVSHSRLSRKHGANAKSDTPSIGNAGSAIAYQSLASDLVAPYVDGYPGQPDIFRWTAKKSKNRLVTKSATHPGQSQNGISTLIGLSGDGKHVFYLSGAGDAISNFTTSSPYQTYIFDAGTGHATLTSPSTTGPTTASNGNAYFYTSARAIADNGTSAVFLSSATDLIPLYSNHNGGADDLYRYGP